MHNTRRPQSPESVERLRARLAGDLLQPGDPDYDPARRLWNGMVDKRPALIARCADSEDVASCLHFARSQEMQVVVRGGGHNVAGSATCEGGLVLDLRGMNDVIVDPGARRVSVGGGTTIGELDTATEQFGLAVPMGVVTETGIAGLTLGGGLGWMRRKHGLASDALRAVDVVTADGRHLHANADENSDLFWALRGGGGNFGVVTRFVYELFDVGPDVFMLTVFYPASAGLGVLRSMRDFMAGAPEACGQIAVVGYLPELPGVPAAVHGQPMVALVGPYIGPAEEGERLLQPMRSLATPLADLSATMPFVDAQKFFDEDYPSGGRYYWRSLELDELGDEVIANLLSLIDEAPSPASTLDIWFNGGAMHRFAPDATAFSGRSAPFLLGIEANWHEPNADDENIAWARRCSSEMMHHSSGSSYLNFPGLAEDGERSVQASLRSNYERLREIKQRYDPDNLFRTHQPITPAGLPTNG
jgi:hypothetical protein